MTAFLSYAISSTEYDIQTKKQIQINTNTHPHTQRERESIFQPSKNFTKQKACAFIQKVPLTTHFQVLHKQRHYAAYKFHQRVKENQ